MSEPQDNEQTPKPFRAAMYGHTGDAQTITCDVMCVLATDYEALKHRLAAAESERDEAQRLYATSLTDKYDARDSLKLTNGILEQTRAQLSTALAENARVRAERDQLADWKAQMLAVESEWDAQEIARLLGATLGQSCRKVISQRVPEVLSGLSALRVLADGLAKALEAGSSIVGLKRELQEARIRERELRKECDRYVGPSEAPETDDDSRDWRKRYRKACEESVRISRAINLAMGGLPDTCHSALTAYRAQP